jgi:hypothetical protein
MTKRKAALTPPSSRLTLPSGRATEAEAMAILWKIARSSRQSGTARVSAIRLLLMALRERDGAEISHNAALNARAQVLLAQVRRPH